MTAGVSCTAIRVTAAVPTAKPLSTATPECAAKPLKYLAHRLLPYSANSVRDLDSRAPVAQLDRVSDYESEGQRFESSLAHHFFPTTQRFI